ncbi:putative glycosyltransferase EpsE [Rubripirellula tenax]|uniref:Putative glycosyltransferase EpsE n=2 Tax=Rubripirellula tenax TaxID=2528015 RepID=A0A5C6ECR1_9BACT|nr:putative glycosyltransferase EpsE [Rubripirellula tenax]
MENWRSVSGQPLVSICCATFNHVEYIEDALRGFLAQVTTFPYEIVIRDDASTDGTAGIVENYVQRYPRIIRSVCNSENRFCKGERASHVWPSIARGDYFAFCEGDDFWIIPDKLQKQVDLLERHPDAVLVGAEFYWCRQDDDGLHLLRKGGETDDKTELVFHNQYFHTATIVVRANVFRKMVEEHLAGHTEYHDKLMLAILILSGPFAALSEVASVYRMTGRGTWTSLDHEAQLKWEIAVSRRFGKRLPGRQGRDQRGNAFRYSARLLAHYAKHRQVVAFIRTAPVALWYGILSAPDYFNRRILGTRDDSL